MYQPNHSLIRKYQSAFTLVEVLLALFIFVIVVGIITGSMVQVLNNSKIIKDKESHLMDLQTMLSILQFDLMQVVEAPLFSNNNQARGSFYANSHMLHFYKLGNVNPDYRFNRTSIEEVQYTLENNTLFRMSKNSNEGEFFKQALIGKVNNLTWTFYDDNAKQYTLWPPVQDFAYKTPIAIVARITFEQEGIIELAVETK